MPNYRLLLPILTEIFRKKSFSPISLIQVQNSVRNVTLKFFCGLILSSICIYSMIVAGEQLNIILLANPNGIYFSILFFTCVAIICACLVFALFKNSDFYLRKSKAIPISNEFDVQRTVSTFVQAFVDGLTRSKNQST